MRVYDIIIKKRNGKSLTKEEIDFVIKGYISGNIPDYQMSALLMCIYFNGMDKKELKYFTESMKNLKT
jgi:pyrimidine-nucleoside phosphorylase